jgi:hypothetical protein
LTGKFIQPLAVVKRLKWFCNQISYIESAKRHSQYSKSTIKGTYEYMFKYFDIKKMIKFP